MTPRRLSLCLTTLAVLATACARDVAHGGDSASAAAGAPDPRAADDAGLLVAIVADEQGQDTATATLLLDWRDGTPRLGAATPGILVADARGYQWVGSITR